MPNWCSNQLTVTGTEENVAAFAEKATNAAGSLSLECLRPSPDFDEDGDNPMMPNWYQWRVANWGTKWDICADDEPVFADVADGSRIWMFSSAWSPPGAAIHFAAEQHPELRFVLKYDEPGNDFAGSVVWANGEIEQEWEGQSTSTVLCAVPDCYEYVDSRDPFEDDSEPVVAFCDDHAFEAAVYQADQEPPADRNG